MSATPSMATIASEHYAKLVDFQETIDKMRTFDLIDRARPRCIYLVAMLITCFGLVLFRHPTLELAIALLSAAVIIVGFLPALVLTAQPNTMRPPIPLFALSGIFYAVFYGIAVFFLFPLHEAETGQFILYQGVRIDGISTDAMIVVLLGLSGMYGGYAVIRRLTSRRSIPRLRISSTTLQDGPIILTSILMIAHLAYLFVPDVRAHPSVGQFLGPIGILGLAYFYVVWRRRNSASNKAGIGLLIVGAAIIGKYVGSAYLTPVIMLFVALMVLEYWLVDKIPWKPAALLVVSVIVIYPMMTSVRDQLWRPDQAYGQFGSIVVSVKTIFQTAIKTVEGKGRRYFGLATRVAHAGILTHVIEQTPKHVPFWDGETYRPLLTSMIPRALWRGKPEERTGSAFGRRYGFVDDKDNSSINLPWITELFANFGWVGTLLGMTIIGGLIGVLERTLSDPSMSDLEVVVGMSVLLPLFYQESNFSLMTGSIILYIVCIWIYFSFGSKILAAIFANKQDNEH